MSELEFLPPPKVNVHNPSITIGLPFSSLRVPRKFPSESNAFIFPSPKLPTRMSPLNRPKANDARATPHGEFNAPREAKRRNK